MVRTLLVLGEVGFVTFGFQSGSTLPVFASMAARLLRAKVVPSVLVTCVKLPPR
jgi:hypothetical protein